MLHVVADVKTAEDLALPVPRPRRRGTTASARRETVTVEPSDELLELRRRPRRAGRQGPQPGGRTRTKTTCSRSPATAAAPPWTCAWLGPAADDARQDRARPPTGSPPSGRRTATTSTSTPTAAPTRSAGRCSWCSATWAPPAPGWNVYDELRDQLAARGRAPRGGPVHPRGQDRPGQGPAVRRLPRRPGRRPGRLHREDGRRHQRAGPGHRPAPPRRPLAARRRRPARGPHPPPGQPQPRGARSSGT